MAPQNGSPSPETADSLRNRAARIRRHARDLQGDDAARLREFANELEERATAIEAQQGDEGTIG